MSVKLKSHFVPNMHVRFTAYGEELEHDIRGDTRGHYQTALLALCKVQIYNLLRKQEIKVTSNIMVTFIGPSGHMHDAYIKSLLKVT